MMMLIIKAGYGWWYGCSDDDVDRHQVLKDAKVETWLAVHRRGDCWFEKQQIVVNCVQPICSSAVKSPGNAAPVQWTIQIGCQVDGVVGGPWRVAPWESSHRSLRELHRLGKTQRTIALLVQQCPVSKFLNTNKVFLSCKRPHLQHSLYYNSKCYRV